MRWNDSDRRDTEARDACNDHRLETPLEDNTRVGTTVETNPFLLVMTLRPAYHAPVRCRSPLLDRQGSQDHGRPPRKEGSKRSGEGTAAFGVPPAEASLRARDRAQPWPYA